MLCSTVGFLCTRLYAGVLRSKKREDFASAVRLLRLLEIICEIVIKHWGRINSKAGRNEEKKREFAWDKSRWSGTVYKSCCCCLAACCHGDVVHACHACHTTDLLGSALVCVSIKDKSTIRPSIVDITASLKLSK